MHARISFSLLQLVISTKGGKRGGPNNWSASSTSTSERRPSPFSLLSYTLRFAFSSPALSPPSPRSEWRVVFSSRVPAHAWNTGAHTESKCTDNALLLEPNLSFLSRLRCKMPTNRSARRALRIRHRSTGSCRQRRALQFVADVHIYYVIDGKPHRPRVEIYM